MFFYYLNYFKYYFFLFSVTIKANVGFIIKKGNGEHL